VGNRALLPDQNHRAIKRIMRPMLGSKTYRSARMIFAGIEIKHMICKGQFGDLKD
jgi:putative transposase